MKAYGKVASAFSNLCDVSLWSAIHQWDILAAYVATARPSAWFKSGWVREMTGWAISTDSDHQSGHSIQSYCEARIGGRTVDESKSSLVEAGSEAERVD